jgi:alpha-tubulin suppressor-like RCC1 family protein
VVRIKGAVLSNIVALAAGEAFSLGLHRDGTVVCWGQNDTGLALSNIIAIAAAGARSFAVEKDGSVMQWDWDPSLSQHGQVSAVEGLSNVVAVSTHETGHGTRNIALRKDGTVVSWGVVSDDETLPVGLSNVVAVSAGAAYSLALKGDGTVIGWGSNQAGQATGIPRKDDPHFSFFSSGPVTLHGQLLTNVASIAAGSGYSIAVKKDGTLVAWGRIRADLFPIAVPEGLSNVVAAAAADLFCLAITTNRAVAEHFTKMR